MISIDNIGKVLESRFPILHTESSAESSAKKAKVPVFRKLGREAGGFHGRVSLFMEAMGVLLIVFGCVFAVMASYNAMVAFGVALIAAVTGTSFIGTSKIVEAAELYVLKNSPGIQSGTVSPAENKTQGTSRF